MAKELILRDLIEEDLPIFFTQQLDPDANFMAAFTSKDPTDEEAFTAHWQQISTDPTIFIRTIVVAGQVAGSVLSYETEDKPEVSYWIGKEYWGKGIATYALSEFLLHVNKTRPIYARVAKDNLASQRVLEKCGFVSIGESIGYANARNAKIKELLLELQAQ